MKFRLEDIVLYDNGGKVQITRSLLVRCDGKLIGHLVPSGDEEKQWWDLEVYDINRIYVHDGVFLKLHRQSQYRELASTWINTLAGVREVRSFRISSARHDTTGSF